MTLTHPKWTPIQNLEGCPAGYEQDGKRCGAWEVQWEDGVVASGQLIDGMPADRWTWRWDIAGAEKIVRPCYIKGPWKSGMVLERYRTEVGQLLSAFKYRENKKAGEKLIEFACKLLLRHNIRHDFIVPVPSSTNKEVTEELAQGLAKCLGIPARPGALTTQNTTTMKKLPSREQRIETLGGAISASSRLLSGKSVLLVDDLFDTGATLEIATKVAYNQGKAKTVSVFAFAGTKKLYDSRHNC